MTFRHVPGSELPGTWLPAGSTSRTLSHVRAGGESRLSITQRGRAPRLPLDFGCGNGLYSFVAAGGSVSDAAALVGIRLSTAKRHLADLRARSGLTTEQLIYRGRAEGWLVVPSLEA